MKEYLLFGNKACDAVYVAVHADHVPNFGYDADLT